MTAPQFSSSGAGRTVHVVQGEFAISKEEDVVLSTVLGSCVAACLFDAQAGVGGMNHYLLPQGHGESADNRRYGVNAMELLINELLKSGAQRSRLQGKLFGGARMMAGLSDIGTMNSEFGLSFLEREGIPCVGESLGGRRARRVRFWPASGRAQQLLLGGAETVPVKPVRPQPVEAPAADLELF